MSPRRPSVNEEMRRRSRERLLRATVELVEERGYESTTLGDIADRAGTARGLVSYYFPGKRQLLQSAAHRLMHTELSAALERPCGLRRRKRVAGPGDRQRAGAAGAVPRADARAHVRHPADGRFQRVRGAAPPGGVTARCRRGVGLPDPEHDYRMLRAQLMGGVFAQLIPGAAMPLPHLRRDLFRRYALGWELGVPPGGPEGLPPGGTPLPDPAQR